KGRRRGAADPCLPPRSPPEGTFGDGYRLRVKLGAGLGNQGLGAPESARARRRRDVLRRPEAVTPGTAGRCHAVRPAAGAGAPCSATSPGCRRAGTTLPSVASPA